MYTIFCDFLVHSDAEHVGAKVFATILSFSFAAMLPNSGNNFDELEEAKI